MTSAPNVVPCGGRGNSGHLIDRETRICAAGKPTNQADFKLWDCFRTYTLQDHADALIHDAVQPSTQRKKLLPMRKEPPPDYRYAGMSTSAMECLHPPIKSSIQNIVNDLKETVYESNWKKVLGQVADMTPFLPEGMDIYNTTFGKKTPKDDSLYEVILPPVAIVDKTPPSKSPGFQVSRDYHAPFSDSLTYGHRNMASDVRGRPLRCALQDDRNVYGTSNYDIASCIEAEYVMRTRAKVGESLKKQRIEDMLPEDFVFGECRPPSDAVSSSMAHIDKNDSLEEFRGCLAHLNTLRRNLQKRLDPTFFKRFYLNLKYHDREHTNWLPKSKVFDACAQHYIRFDHAKIEYLLELWGATAADHFLDYRFFIDLLNYKKPLPLLPRIRDFDPSDLHFETTYEHMTQYCEQIQQRIKAGLPSARTDLDFKSVPAFKYKAGEINMPGEATVKGCIAPSTMAKFRVNHRDMYAARKPDVIKRTFEATNDKPYTEEEFKVLWERAQKKHSRGLVCYQTFKEAIQEKEDEAIVPMTIEAICNPN